MLLPLLMLVVVNCVMVGLSALSDWQILHVSHTGQLYVGHVQKASVQAVLDSTGLLYITCPVLVECCLLCRYRNLLHYLTP